MAIDELADLSFQNEQFQNLIKPNESSFKQEKERIKKCIKKAQENSGFRELMKSFQPHVQPYEGAIPYLYIDSNGYPTIGCGHLIGFGWTTNFWTHPVVQELEKQLQKQIDQQDLKKKADFQNIHFPEDIDQFLKLSSDDYLQLYKIPCVCYGFLDTQSIGEKQVFEQCNDSGLRKRIKEANSPNRHNSKESALDRVRKVLQGVKKTPLKEMNQAIFSAYTQLIGLSIKLRVRQKSLGKAKNHNPFGGASFYTFNNFNTQDSLISKQSKSDSDKRFDYSKDYAACASEFKDPPKEFNGTLKKDLVVIRYHGDSPNQTYRWVTPALWANQHQTLKEILEKAAILKSYGEKTHVVVIKIPAGAQVRFLHGKAKAQTDIQTGEERSGGIEQYCFYDFDPKWIWGTNEIPVGYGYNNLILTTDKIEKLETEDIFQKIFELNFRCEKHLGQFPLSAQLALLDLAFNGAIDKKMIEEAIEHKWEMLASNPKRYHHDDPAYKDRDKQIQNWFLEAAKAKQLTH